jgi:putative phosphoesterase
VDAVVLADTHLGRGLTRLPGPVLDAISGADVILHAGDITSTRALAELQALGTVHAVLGNNDGALHGVLPEVLTVELDGVPVTLVHDSGPTPGRAGRMARRYPDAAVVVFGHSHVPVDEMGIGGQRLFNPGSPTQRRSQPRPTFGHLRFEAGIVVAHSVEALDLPTSLR